LTPEQIRSGSLHKTNKAFERYIQTKAVDALKVYRKTTELTEKEGKVVDLEKNKKLTNH